ncbi:MAG: lipase family protein [Bacteroidetes bacterium]|jgi:hypothetical protein|nr:lipase family protein [Bacteroidota bacterium]
MKYFYILLFFLFTTSVCNAQLLKPGFDAKEYLEMLRISRQQFNDPIKDDHTPLPKQYGLVYRSPEGPLKNRWDLWVNNKGIAVISIRGTTQSDLSWLENFYAAMVPATGKLHISDSEEFTYSLAANPKAGVHVGWLLGLADLSKTILPKIYWLYNSKGIRNFIIVGHSQGAAIACLLRSYLGDLQSKQLLGNDITFKTYCSAPPKPGNIYYSYDFNYLTRNGWCVSVVNAADWVPQTPFTIQTISNFNTPNPFVNFNDQIKNQPFFKRLYIKHIFNKLKKEPESAQQTHEEYLGKLAYTFVQKQLPKFKEPVYLKDNSFTACGTPIILMPDNTYHKQFPDDPKDVFEHHMFWPYYYLAQAEYLNQ